MISFRFLILLTESVDGSLTAKIERGNLNIHLTNHTEVSLVTTDGSANISIQDSTPTEIIAQTENFDVDDSIGLKIKSRDTTTSTVEGMFLSSFNQVIYLPTCIYCCWCAIVPKHSGSLYTTQQMLSSMHT